MSAPTFRCGHPRTEANTYEWLDRSRAQLRQKCKRCVRARRRKMCTSDAYRARQRANWASGNDPRKREPRPDQHGTVTGYNYGCREACCREAIATAHRIQKLKRKAKTLGIPIPRDLVMVRRQVSLDAVAEARYGMDRVMIGTEWDDPTGDMAVGA